MGNQNYKGCKNKNKIDQHTKRERKEGVTLRNPRDNSLMRRATER
jgi:hypothetical protein